MPLLNIFKPKHFFALKRIGAKNDGGYLVGENSIVNADYLISFGINDDWSFESEIKSIRKDLLISCFDDKLCLKFLFKNFISQLIFFPFNFNFYLLKERFKYLFTYLLFIKKVDYQKKKITNKNIKNIFFDKNKILLKIDIEGSEYRLLNDVIKIQKKLVGLIIEFHDVDLHLEKIKKFISQFNLDLVHIHGNNYSELDNFNNPTMLEISFEKNPIILKKNSELPHFQDQPNNKKKSDYTLKFNRINLF